MNIIVMGNLVDRITHWNTDRADIDELVDRAPFLPSDDVMLRREANRDDAVDLLHSIAMLIEQAKAEMDEPWCNHDAPGTASGDVCECGERVP